MLIDHAEEFGQGFKDRDIGAESPPYRAHLEPDHAGADDAEPLWHRTYRQRTIVTQDPLLLVELDPAAAARSKPVATITCLATMFSFGGSDTAISTPGVAARNEGTVPVEERDLVLLETDTRCRRCSV